MVIDTRKFPLHWLGYVPLAFLLLSYAGGAALALGCWLHSCGLLPATGQALSADYLQPLRFLFGLALAVGLTLSLIALWAGGLVAFVLAFISVMVEEKRRLNLWVLGLAALPFVTEWLGWW